MTSYEAIAVEHSGSIAHITLNRPDAANGMNDTMTRELARGARGSHAAVKKLLLMTYRNGLEEQMEQEGQLIAGCADSPDGREGIAAFVEKRQPRYT
jgi:2-(1,2-epoxy-1,2-dihydrophenyl)acetyl-CoA isomerase